MIEKATIGTTTRTPLATSNSEEGSNETPDEKEQRLLRKEIRYLKDALKLLKAPSWTKHINDDDQNNNDNNNGTGLIGVTRYTIQSDEYHQQNKNASNEFFRFRSWSYTKAFLEDMFDVKYEPPVGGPLSPFEQCLLTLTFIESNHTHQFIAQIFGYKDHSAVSRIIDAWLPKFGEVGRSLSILPFITPKLIDDLEPQSYKDLG